VSPPRLDTISSTNERRIRERSTPVTPCGKLRTTTSTTAAVGSSNRALRMKPVRPIPSARKGTIERSRPHAIAADSRKASSRSTFLQKLRRSGWVSR
jgi:hypothetical protein